MATVSYSSLASMFLADIGAPDNKGTNTAVQTWIRRESGGNIIQNNPLNIHYDVALSYGITPDSKWYSQSDGAYVAGFSTPERGMAATANILNRNIHGYRQASDALRANNPEGFLNAIAASDWAAGHYGATVNTVTHTITGGTNSLIMQYHVLLGDPAKGSPGQTPGPGTGSTPLTGSGSAQGGDGRATGETFTEKQVTDLLGGLVGKATWTQWAQGVSGQIGTDPGKIDPGLYDNISQALVALKIDPNSTITAADLAKVAAWVASHPIKTSVDSAQDAVDKGLAGLPDFVSIIAYIADPAHWLYIAALLVGVALTGYGIITLVKAYGAPVPLPIPTPG